MIIKYRIISAEDEEFVRDIELKSSSKFIDFHLAIQYACGYDSGLLTTFYLSNSEWDKLDEVAQERIDEESQANVLLMEDTLLDNFSPYLGQHYIYIFDFFSIRAFFIEVVNIREESTQDKNLEFPICTYSVGTAPVQFFIDDIDDMDDDSDDMDDDSDDIFEDIDELFEDEFGDEYYDDSIIDEHDF